LRPNFISPAPPTLSQQIKWLESYLGVTLFTRSTKKKVELTFAGQQFQKRALALIESFDQAERFAREVARGEVGDVRLGYVVSAATSGDVKNNHRGRKNRRAECDDSHSAHGNAAANQGHQFRQSGHRLMRRMYSYPVGISEFGLPPQRFRLVLHRDHPMAKQKRITAAALAKYRFVAYELDAEIGFWRNITAVLPPGTVPQIAQRAPDAISLLTLISANIGISVLPESFKNIIHPPVIMRDIAGPAKYSHNAVVYRANDASPAVQAALKAIRKAFA
jgi:DNA-binding transcriptional LysR family regulator